MSKSQEHQYRWFVITLAGFTGAFGVAVPMFCMPVFFKEISNDIGLSLVQLGTVGGMSGLAGLLTTLPGGLIGDRYGTKRTLSVACILAGTAGALRGLSGGFISLALSMLLFGFITRTISLNIYKTAGIWFSGREVVIANGIISTGFGMGFTLGAMIMEIEGVGASYAGTAIGLIWTFGALGNFITPPLGNSLASIDPGFPFIFWGSLVIVPLLTLRFVREKESQLFNPTKPVLCLIGERESGPTAKLEG